ncbi:MAG: aminotransferase class V-fold PLP-dependent enzyme [Verrucomicrobia bacterium]|nr:aminotransferase class V-fold PLP-dependent enzyme [Verrucomicrobiota bacterium]MBV9272518.1 aminotransferase class V-fold PLP-dependent enzyme [Verrucomicrobiota bacterium]
MDLLASLLTDAALRQRFFPITKSKIFMAHAAVTALPGPVAEAMNRFIQKCSEDFSDFSETLSLINQTRDSAGRLLHASPDEIALLGPTSLGLSLFANGIAWHPGDEVICYLDDYPANVYPWINLREQDVSVRFVEPAVMGEITVETVQRLLTPKTRLVALASCNFVSGYRIDIDSIGKLLRERNVLFSLDAIQTLGAFPTTVEYVDFLSADAHKWMLGPAAVGVVYVRKECFDLCRPTLLGAWNIKCPGFTAQDHIEFQESAQRYEPGILNLPGIAGMKAAIDMLLEVGIEKIAERIGVIRERLIKGAETLGFELLGVRDNPACISGIATLSHPTRDLPSLAKKLAENRIICSPRQDRKGKHYIRFSPHFYNTEHEVDRVLEALD